MKSLMLGGGLIMLDENNDVDITISNYDYNNEDYPRNIIGQYSINGGSSTASSDTVIEYY